MDECNSFTQKPTHLFSYFNLRLEFRGRKKKKAKVFPSPVYPCTHRAPWISTESGDREQTGELFQKPHSEDPVSRLMAPILAFHQPSSQWTHCSALTVSSGPLTNIIPSARAKIVPLQNIRMCIYKDITTSAIVSVWISPHVSGPGKDTKRGGSRGVAAASGHPNVASEKKKAGRSFSLQTWQQSVHSKHSFSTQPCSNLVCQP